mmetsp:Transcript_54819/g.90877  ORF Transcript_54819/g.90877 Transcript_54819/m.90877 type:complete len:95 (+) Transcript_54819:69-353(+)
MDSERDMNASLRNTNGRQSHAIDSSALGAELPCAIEGVKDDLWVKMQWVRATARRFVIVAGASVGRQILRSRRIGSVRKEPRLSTEASPAPLRS